jgi:TRAP-type uncharacterized transport system fused permease subunit
VTAILGVWLVSAALAGFFKDRLSTLKRWFFASAGLLALVPSGAFEGALLTDVIGTVLGVLLIANEVIRRPTQATAETNP